MRGNDQRFAGYRQKRIHAGRMVSDALEAEADSEVQMPCPRPLQYKLTQLPKFICSTQDYSVLCSRLPRLRSMILVPIDMGLMWNEMLISTCADHGLKSLSNSSASKDTDTLLEQAWTKQQQNHEEEKSLRMALCIL